MNYSDESAADFSRLFNPNDMTEWVKYSPVDFLGVMLLELRQQNERIQIWSELLANHPHFRSQTFQFNDRELAATFFTDVNVSASGRIDRLLAILQAYKENLSATENK